MKQLKYLLLLSIIVIFSASSGLGQTTIEIENIDIKQKELEEALRLIEAAKSETIEEAINSSDECHVGESRGLCDDLYPFTCAPGEFHDGTGTASTSAIAVQNRVLQLRNDALEKFRANFLEALKNPQNSYFKKIALSTMGLTHSPFCTPPKDVEDDCLTRVAGGLSELAVTKVFHSSSLPPRGMVESYAEIENIDLLIHNPVYTEAESSLATTIKTELRNNPLAAKIKGHIFPQVQELLIQRIGDLVENPEVKRELIEKIRGIRFEGTDCSSLSGNQESSSIASLLVPNAFYDPLKNSFQYCNGFLLTNQSEFQIAHVIAHELSHSVDPCRIAYGPSDFRIRYSDPQNVEKSEREFPLKGLIACLRDSVPARRFIITEAAVSSEEVPPQEGGEATEEKVETIGPITDDSAPPKKSPFCEADQIGESFSDWLAAEVLPDYITQNHPDLSQDQIRIGYSNVFRGTCQNIQPVVAPSMDTHPPTQNRINQILLVHPKIRQQMGCPEELTQNSHYCSPKRSGK